jgi:hypothetical protein
METMKRDYGTVYRRDLDRRGYARRNYSKRIATFVDDLWKIPRGSTVLVPSNDAGNFMGCLDARETFPDAIAYGTKDSFSEISRILRMPYKCVEKTSPTGEMVYDDFDDLLDVSRPAIVCADADAGDDVRKITSILERYNMIHKAHVHVDATLSGFVTPFVKHGMPIGGIVRTASASFGFFETPFPCGAYVNTNGRHRIIDQRETAYAAAFLNNVVAAANCDRDVVRCLETADRLVAGVRSVGLGAKKKGVRVFLDRWSIPEDIVRRWNLEPGPSMIVVPSVTNEVVDAFVQELNSRIQSK